MLCTCTAAGTDQLHHPQHHSNTFCVALSPSFPAIIMGADKTEFSSLDHVCISCNAVKIIKVPCTSPCDKIYAYVKLREVGVAKRPGSKVGLQLDQSDCFGQWYKNMGQSGRTQADCQKEQAECANMQIWVISGYMYVTVQCANENDDSLKRQRTW